MIASIKNTSKTSPETLHSQFIDFILPAVQLHASIQFRHLEGQDRDDAIQESMGVAWYLFIQAIETGKDPTSFPSCIADYAVRRVRCGRLLAGKNTRDVLSPVAQQQNGFEVHSLDDDSCSQDVGWKAALAQDSKHATPADTVAFRVDFDRWMGGLPSRDRAIGESLLVGDRPGQVATKFSLSPSMISKLSWKLQRSWARFQNAVPVGLQAAKVPA